MIITFLFLILAISGCGGSSSDTTDASEDTHITAEEFVDDLIYYWNGVDYSVAAADGYTDTDTDGDVDTNDAINFIETLKANGCDVPETTLKGIYENYYTEAGYDEGLEPHYAKVDFTYTTASSVTQDDLKAADWTGLEIGDLIFIDFHKDYLWDNAAVYLGAYGGYTHAVIMASDLYDETVILDLDDSSEVIRLDIDAGFSAVRKPAFDSYPMD